MANDWLEQLKPQLAHDPARPEHRRPLGALSAGSTITLALRSRAGLLTSAGLVLFGAGWEQQHQLHCLGESWSVELELPQQPEVCWYYFRLQIGNRQLYYGASERAAGPGCIYTQRPPAFQLTLYAADFATPAWLSRGVMYQIFPDRFAPGDAAMVQAGVDYHRGLGRRIELHSSWQDRVKWQAGAGESDYYPNDFFGGTLDAIAERLPYLSSLGVDVLYLNPIFEADSNHRYNTADYLQVDPILGGNAAFARLSEAAAEQGIRLVLDGVFSHTGADSRYFDRYHRYGDNGAYQRQDSPYAAWYDFRSFPDDYRSWWGFVSLPEVNEQDQSWQDFVIRDEDSVMRHWLRAGAAGFRLDVADELPDEVLALMRDCVKQEGCDKALIGEVWEDPTTKVSYGQQRSYVLGQALDSVMNYPLRDALVSFGQGRSSAHQLADLLLRQRLNYPPPLYYSLLNLLSSHDIPRVRTALAQGLDERQLSRAQQAGFIITAEQDEQGRALQYLLAAVQYSLPGIPSIYYGDEQGMQGFLDPFNRAPFEPGRYDLEAEYAQLGRLRHQLSALTVGAMAAYAPKPDVAAVLRLICGGSDVFGAAADDGAVLTVVNRADQQHEVVVDLYAPGRGLTEAQLNGLREAGYSGARCLLSGAEAQINHGLLRLSLAPRQAYMFEFS